MEKAKQHRPKTVVVEEVVDQPENKESTSLSEVEQEIKHPVHTYPTNDESTPIAESPNKETRGLNINVSFVFVTLTVAFFVAILSGALYVYFNGVQSIKVISSPTPEPTPSDIMKPSATPFASLIPTPTPKALTAYSISVLNGGGKIGEAGKVKSLIEKSGFKVGRTANADSFNYPQTLIQVKETVPNEVTKKLEEALKGAYQVKIGDNLDNKSSFDVIVTIGVK